MTRRTAVPLLLGATLALAAGCAKETETAKVAAAAPAPKSEVPAAPAAAAKPAKLSFNEHVQPILAENCYACHGADPGSRKADLRLDRAEFAFAPRKDTGPAIVKGQPDQSPLIRRIESKDEKVRMPPPEAHKELKPEHIALLRQWVVEGAEYQEHWSFVTPVRATPPAVAKARESFVRNPIDRFIVARLEREGLAPSAEADRRTLLRRAALDLTGIVPSPEAIEAFVNDQSPDAYERAVDRLLASPRWGEHRARYWLDYVRYADTHGIHFDNYRAIWPYRDYVIKAFNANKPFSAFVREQLAGDLLPAKTLDELAATGFMRSNMTTNEGGTVPEEVHINQTRDRVEAFGATFLGLTTGCAACHDHKFDPVTQKDFYGLAAYLGNTAEKPWDSNIADPGPVLRTPPEENRAAAEFVLARRAEIQAKFDARQATAREALLAWIAAGNKPKTVSDEKLQLRLKLDENGGDVVKNSAPDAKIKTAKADTNPLIWGENSWLWPSMRMDIFTRLPLGNIGDVDTGDRFSFGGWILLRGKPGLGGRGTGNGTLFARMGDAKRRGGAGWALTQENSQFIVTLAAGEETPAADAAKADIAAVTTPPATPVTGNVAALPPPPPKRAAVVATRATFDRDEWIHVFATYDGTRRGQGVRIFINGQPADVDIRTNTLTRTDSIKTDATAHLGRRDDTDPMRETRFQDVRFYERTLTPEEVARLPFEHVAAEILAREPNPAKWTTDETFVAQRQFFLGQADEQGKALLAALAAHDAAFEALTKGGTPTLIAREKVAPAYSDLLKRGDYFARVGRVEATLPHFLPPLPAGAPANRRGLAEWLLSPAHPLMSRVTVNRAWQEIFGRGIVDSAGDFGIMGSRPTHPELLDWLAVEFRESGWDVKKLYKLLVTSATYRQSAAVTPDRLLKDPANRFLSRGPRFRMDGEMLRDSALATSGLLVDKIGGPSVKPYQPPGLWEEVAMPESNTRTYVPDKGEGLYRRSLYTFWKRASMPPSMETFDGTSREVVCVKRARSNTPLQAFVTMNDPQWVEAARKLAERALKASADEAGRFDFIARTTIGRPLDAKELGIARGSAAKYRAHYADAANAEAVKALLAVGEAPADATLPAAEIAAWTMVANEFLNLDEFLTK